LLRAEGTYLITGGLGGIGLALAGFLARTCRARLILIGRSAFPERAAWDEWLALQGDDEVSDRIRKVRELEALGAHVLALQADVTSAEQMRAVVKMGFGRFGALNGVIHAAGVPGGGVIALRTHSAVHEVIAPKVKGTQNLYLATRELEPDFFVCCSSMAAVLGPAGQFDYCAANAFQDAFAHARDGRDRTRFMSIDWDAWKDVGMAVKASEPHGISCAEGTEVFERLLQHPRPQWAVCTREPSFEEPQIRPPPVSGHARGLEPRTSVMLALEEMWRELLGVQNPGAHADFFDLGGDSLLAVQLAARLQARFARGVSLRQLLQMRTIAVLADFFSADAIGSGAI
jgi:NADP-dependent 3-hydroxy acid dehydrogenase YdfG/acyl carrier protein